MTINELCSLTSTYGEMLQSDFMAFANMIATKNAPEKYEQINMHPRKIQWNENSIKCSFKNGNVRTYQYGNKLVTKFAASEPIILGGFTCGLVGTVVGRAFQQLKSFLLVDVEIFETRVFASANGNILLKMQTKLHSVEADTLLPHPILIRPGYIYGISIGCLPDGYIF